MYIFTYKKCIYIYTACLVAYNGKECFNAKIRRLAMEVVPAATWDGATVVLRSRHSILRTPSVCICITPVYKYMSKVLARSCLRS